MASEVTQRQRAEAVVNTVKAELPPIWLGGRQRMVLVDAIVTALEDARQEALKEARQIVSTMFDQQASELPDYYAALLDVGNALDRLASEGG